MSDDERVLRSFVPAEEQWQDSRTVTSVAHSKGQLPPQGGQQTVAVTDERLLWFTDELEEVTLADVDEIDHEYVERQTAPPMVLGGGLLFVLGIFASIGAFLANVGDTFVVAMPAMTGLAAFVVARVVASVTGREGETLAGHRLRLWTDDGPISLWGDDEDTMAAIESAIRGDGSSEVASPATAADDSVADDSTVHDEPVANVETADDDRTAASESDAEPTE